MAFLQRKLFKTFCHAFMRVSETFFQAEYLFSHHAKAEVSRFDYSCMDRTHRDLMHAIAGHRDERVRNRDERKLLLPIHIFPQRDYLLLPATMSQPTTLVPGVSSDTEQIIDRALHAPGCRKQTPKIWVRQVCRFKGMSYDKHIINRQISSIYLEATIATAIIGSPQRQQLSTGVTELLRGGEPFVAVYAPQGGRQICRQRDRIFLRNVRTHIASSNQLSGCAIPLCECQRNVQAQYKHNGKMNKHRN